MRDIIIKLYFEDKLPMTELIRCLHGMGFEVK